MLYPAELQALPQPRDLTVAQDFSLCPACEMGETRERSETGRNGRQVRKRDRQFEVLGLKFRKPQTSANVLPPVPLFSYVSRVSRCKNP
jgi:hypothetical protein